MCAMGLVCKNSPRSAGGKGFLYVGGGKRNWRSRSFGKEPDLVVSLCDPAFHLFFHESEVDTIGFDWI